jgi:effector-binding domain-containing protein
MQPKKEIRIIKLSRKKSMTYSVKNRKGRSFPQGIKKIIRRQNMKNKLFITALFLSVVAVDTGMAETVPDEDKPNNAPDPGVSKFRASA